MTKIRDAFKDGKAFIPFLTCGDPDLETTEKLVCAMAEAGADLIELGIPFSDPTAEGPVIQEANVRALSAGTTTDKIFDMVVRIRKTVKISLVFMTYANVVFSYGSERFISKAAEIGINGLIGIAYVLLVEGDLNGPTLGGIFTIMGFSAFGKHPRNIIPVMFGVWLGAYGMHYEPNYPALQLAGLFGTTLAPVAGHFGPVCGILAGFIHSALVLQTGGPVAGLNLYNNGFSGGLIAIVLYPTLTAIIRHRRPKLRDADYYDLFEADQPINMSNWHTHRPTPEEKAAEAAGRMTDDLPEREGFQRMQKNEKKENG